MFEIARLSSAALQLVKMWWSSQASEALPRWRGAVVLEGGRTDNHRVRNVLKFDRVTAYHLGVTCDDPDIWQPR